MAAKLEIPVTAPPSREAEIAARLDRREAEVLPDFILASQDHDDLRYLLAELQQARQERDRMNELALSFERSLTTTEAALQQAREALKGVEWITVRDEGGRFYTTCPFCWADKEARGGHVVGCGLDAALKAGR